MGAAALSLGVAWFLAAQETEPSFPSLRQAREQEIPGTFGVLLDPPPADFRPQVTPREVSRIALGSKAPAGSWLTMALLRDPAYDAVAERPSWVLLVPGLCYFSQKGELVSGSRSQPTEQSSRCADNNLWIEVVDAQTGEGLMSFAAYDASGIWAPARGLS